MEMIQEKYHDACCLTTFFFSRVDFDYWFRIIRRKKVDLFSKKFVLIPIHVSNHWILAVIYVETRTISILDSLLGEDTREHYNKLEVFA
jgi:Ulp1 family protease